MKTKLHFLSYLNQIKLPLTFMLIMLVQSGFSQGITISPWKMNKGGGAISFSLNNHGNPAAYTQANIPGASDPNWVAAPVNASGEINYSVPSILSYCLNQLDFTYFETYINIPANYNVSSLNVSFTAADDGARAYIFNSAHPNGAFIGEISLGGSPTSQNYASLSVAGEINRLVIVQFDDCPSGNNLTGAKVKVNGNVVAINTGGCTTSNFFWSNAPTVSGKTATGTINGIGYTYTSSVNVRTTSNMFAHSTFPASYNVPNANPTIQNIEPSTNTLTFSSPMTNPVLVFSSIGGGTTSVPINFSAPVDVLWSSHAGAGSSFVQNSPTQITGTEAYTIVRMNGTFSSISFDYLTYENYVNFAFGADFSTTSPDTIAPTLTLNGSATQSINAFTTYTDPGATITDNCDTNPAILVSGTVDTNVPGTYTLTYTGVDASGNTSPPLTRVVTVVDPCTPVSFANTNLYIQSSTEATSCQATVNYGLSVLGTTPSVSYTFSGATEGTGTGTGTGQIFNKGITHVTVKATNSCSTSSTSFDITVVDDVKPIAKAKPVTLYLDTNGKAALTAADVNNGSSDNCGIDTYTLDTSGTICGTAAEGNSLTLTAPPGLVITGIDFASYGTPTGTCGNFALGSCNAANSLSIVSSRAIGKNSVTIPALNSVFGDPCGGTVKRLYVQATYGVKSPSLVYDCNNLGTNTVNLIVTDTNGNASIATTTVTVVDNIAPVITAPADINVNATSAAGTVVNYTTPVGTDNCSVTTTITAGLASGATFPIGTTVVTYTATDASQNATSVSFNVTVVGIAPVLGSMSNITVSNDPGLCAAVVSYAATEAVVGIPAATITYDIAPSSTFTNGTTTVTATATNAIGSSSVSFNVTVNDTEKPTVITQPLSVSLDASGNASITAAQINNNSTDNCSIESMSLDITSFTCANIGDNTVTLTVTDTSGNTASQAAIVTVTDGIAPTVTTKNITVELDANGTASITAAQVNNGSSDNCAIESMSLDITSFTCANIGENTVTLTVTDASGNTASQTAVVTVTDGIAPTVITQPISVNLDASGNASITAAQINNGSSDNCAIESMSLDITSFTCANIGDNTVTLTVTDPSGNTATKTAIVTVSDAIAPTVITKDFTIPLANGMATITSDDINNGSFDNCDITLSIDKNTFTCSDIGDHTVTLTATDSSGNTSSETATVTIEGETPEVTIADFNAVETQQANTIFLGFGPQSMALTTSATGGDSFTYVWTASTGEIVSNVANPVISPTTSTTYTVTATNNFGCTTTTTIEVCVMDVRSYNKKGKATNKVTVCHHTSGKKGTKHVMINISANAVMKHLLLHGADTSHGDSLGDCNATCITPNSNPIPVANDSENLLNNLEFNVYPNPSKGVFQLKIANIKAGTQLNLMDVTGKLVSRKTITSEAMSQNITIGNRNLPSGIYILKIVSKEETITKKLIVSQE
ncbi:immunoglobulin-like domain-containing protein [Polaribacter gochangensis]|uniref:immunoglobulin-like domain-containing protein n=1 Tax=Polaribacter gochangensis TaxID=3252903 RepID=UPI0039047BD0